MKHAHLLSTLPSMIAAAMLAGACGETPDGGGGQGPGDQCTEMGCEDGLTIAFSLDEPGSYTVELVADGETITCNAVLPLPPCSSPPTPNCSADDVALGELGCALDPAAQFLEDIVFMGAHPKSVEITVLRDGAEIARSTFTPTYETVTPNGPECEPVCDQAKVSLAVP